MQASDLLFLDKISEKIIKVLSFMYYLIVGYFCYFTKLWGKEDNWLFYDEETKGYKNKNPKLNRENWNHWSNLKKPYKNLIETDYILSSIIVLIIISIYFLLN
jgi:hypothetical protein